MNRLLTVPRGTVLPLLLLLALMAAALTGHAASSGPPELMSYQGYLVDGDDAPIAPMTPENHQVEFRIYDVPQDGVPLWVEQQIVTVHKGNFSVLLGEGDEVSGESDKHGDLADVFNGGTASDRYIGVTITIGETSHEILPLLRMVTSPYAHLASRAVSVDGTAVTTGTVPDARLSSNVALRSGGNAFSGSQSITGGSVGIGTTTPGKPLHLHLNAGNGPDILLTDSETGTRPGLDGVQLGLGDFKDGFFYNYEDDGDVYFGAGNKEVMRLEANGRVGIGTKSPKEALHLHFDGNDGPDIRFTDAQSTGLGVQIGMDSNEYGFFWNYQEGVGEEIYFGAGNREVMRLKGNGNVTVAGTISQTSDRNVKKNFDPVDAQDVLDRVVSLPIQQWTYKAEQDAIRHVGPMAQDFHSAFGLGANDTTITTVDADGVALAAIQGLNQKLERENGRLTQENTDLKRQVTELESKDLSLESRLAALERLIMTSGHSGTRDAVSAGFAQ